MTRAPAFTEHSLRCAIAAARKEGLRVAGFRLHDSTLILQDGAEIIADPIANSETPSKWEDVEA
jgi:hypothetical protein